MNFETMVKMTQKELKVAAAKELTSHGYSVKTAKGYVYAKGEIPVLLIAHLDTVHKQRVKNIFYSKDGTRLLSPEGIGGDDRAGVYIILQIIKSRRCHVLFCEDEEIGGVGARDFTRSKIKPAVNYIVEVDRRGANDAVFYDCDNPEFTEFICGFGFNMEYGSFSDISVIAPHLGLAAVNLSAGYYNEHTRSEFVDLTEMETTIERVIRMTGTSTGKFEYMERKLFSRYADDGQMMLDMWGHIGREHAHKEQLMPLPESAYLIINGHPIEHCDSYLIDIRGNVYDYVADIDAAVRLENATAYSPTGTPLRFSSKNTLKKRVLPLEMALELLGCI